MSAGPKLSITLFKQTICSLTLSGRCCVCKQCQHMLPQPSSLLSYLVFLSSSQCMWNNQNISLPDTRRLTIPFLLYWLSLERRDLDRRTRRKSQNWWRMQTLKMRTEKKQVEKPLNGSLQYLNCFSKTAMRFCEENDHRK